VGIVPETQLPHPGTPPSEEVVTHPGTPPSEFATRDKIQYQLGKKDWQMLCVMNKQLNELSISIAKFNEFVVRKENPEVHERINLAELDQDGLKSAYETFKKNEKMTKNSGHVVLVPPLPPKFLINNTHRPCVSIRNVNNTNTIALTALVLYFKPTVCYYKYPDGHLCLQRHRTVHDYAEEHPEVTPNGVHISHLCHFGKCVNWKHLVMESYVVNLHCS